MGFENVVGLQNVSPKYLGEIVLVVRKMKCEGGDEKESEYRDFVDVLSKSIKQKCNNSIFCGIKNSGFRQVES